MTCLRALQQPEKCVEPLLHVGPVSSGRGVGVYRAQRLQLLPKIFGIPGIRVRPFDTRVRQMFQSSDYLDQRPDLFPARREFREIRRQELLKQLSSFEVIEPVMQRHLFR